MLMYVFAAGGFVLLFGGGEFLVRGAVLISRRLGLPSLLIGMTVVAFCTSAPELVVSLSAALEGRSDIAFGNVVGSNIFNILVVLGVAALIAPIVVSPRELRRDTAVMIAATVLLVAIAMTGEVGRVSAVALIVGIIAYVGLSYRAETRKPASPAAMLHERESAQVEVPGTTVMGVVYLLGGFAALVVGSRFLILGVSEIARTYGVPEAVIGLSVVAAGTSLPELATSIAAAVRRHFDVAVGNVVGSNIFNILGILGITALIRPVSVAERIAAFDLWVMLGVAVLLVPLLLWRGRIGRVAGAVFVLGYIAYLWLLF